MLRFHISIYERSALRNAEITLKFINGENINFIAKEYKMSRTNVKNCIAKTIRKVKTSICRSNNKELIEKIMNGDDSYFINEGKTIIEDFKKYAENHYKDNKLILGKFKYNDESKEKELEKIIIKLDKKVNNFKIEIDENIRIIKKLIEDCYYRKILS